MPSFYGVELGLGLIVTGFVLMIVRIFDTITDPLIGILSDRVQIFSSRRKPWIVIGSVIASIGLYKVLSPPIDVQKNYLLFWSIILYLGWTMVSVPYLAWGAEISRDYNERTLVTSYREGFSVFGIVLTGILIATMKNLGWSNIDVMGAVAWAAIILGFILIPFLLFFVPDQKSKISSPLSPTITNSYKQIWSIFLNKLFLRLLFSWFINGLANGIPAVLFLIYLEHVLQIEANLIPLFVLVYFVAAVATIPLWLNLSQHFGKHRTWCYAMIVASVFFGFVPFISEDSRLFFVVVCLITGATLGADLVLPPSIQADVADYDLLKYSSDRVGEQFALWGMGTKLALAMSVGFAFPMVEFFGFDPLNPSETGRISIIVIYAIIPVVLKFITVLIVWNFPLNSSKQLIIRKRLKSRRLGY